MAYTPTQWVNGQPPALNASNLNKIEAGIVEANSKTDLITEVVVSENAHNSATDTSGYLQDNVPHASNEWTTTDYINVQGWETAYLTAYNISTETRITYYFFFLNKYDSDKNFIECINLPGVREYTVEQDVAYIRFCYKTQEVNDVNLKPVPGTVSDPFRTESRFTNSGYVLNETAAKALAVADNVEITPGKNKFNPAAVTNGYINAQGVITQVGDWVTSDYIDVSSGDPIITTRNNSPISIFFVSIYDEDKTFVEQVATTLNWPDMPYSLPSTAYYLRFSQHSNLIDGLQFEFNSSTSYEPYQLEMKFIKSPYNDMTSWAGKKWVCVGDSLTEVNSRTTMHYHDYIAAATGISVVNMGASGTGYKRTETENKAFYQRVSAIPTNADVVTIFGSGNDLGGGYTLGTASDTGTTTICGCINTTIDNIISRMPRVSLGIVSPTPWVNYPPSTANNAMEQYVEKLREICARRSIPFMDIYHCSNLRPWTAEGRTACYSKDEGNGVHPDENGHKLIAPRFKAFLENLLL